MLSYIQYNAELQNRDEYNAFDITRGYINITGDVVKNVRFRFTPNVKHITDGSLSGSIGVRIKYTFVESTTCSGRSRGCASAFTRRRGSISRKVSTGTQSREP